MKDNSGHQFSEGGEVPKRTIAHKKCAEWLSFCLTIGYEKHQLDELEKIWMNSHDHNGNLIKNFSLPATGSVATPKPDTLEKYRAYLNYKDVQKDNEELRKVVKELLPVAEDHRLMIFMGPFRKDKRQITTHIIDIISRAKALLEH